MSFWDILGTLLIKPLQLLFEVVFVMANRIIMRSSPRKVFLICETPLCSLSSVTRSSSCIASARLYSGSTRKFIARLSAIMARPGSPTTLFAITNTTSKRS